METLSVNEAAVLIGTDQETIRTDIKRRMIIARKESGRLGFTWEDLAVLSTIYDPDVRQSNNLKKWTFNRYHRLLDESVSRRARAGTSRLSPWKNVKSRLGDTLSSQNEFVLRSKSQWLLRINDSVLVDIKRGLDRIDEIAELYAQGLSRIESDPERLAGEPVFKGTRLAVRQVGARHERGDSVAGIRKDYPYLTESDVRFARLYWLANPARGRPPKSGTPREEASN